MSEVPAKKAPRKRSKPVAKPKPAAHSPAPPAAAATDAVAAAPDAALFQFDIGVRWRDLDAFNHVNNSVFLTYLEEARLVWLEQLDGPWLTDQIAPVLAAATVNYRRPIGWPETVRVQLFCERLGRSSLTMAHRISSAGDDGVLYSDGSVVMVWVDGPSGKAAELPEAVRRACSR